LISLKSRADPEYSEDTAVDVRDDFKPQLEQDVLYRIVAQNNSTKSLLKACEMYHLKAYNLQVKLNWVSQNRDSGSNLESGRTSYIDHRLIRSPKT
jgi:hypothetical protein